MVRELDIGSKNFTKIIVCDEPGAGGACHSYVVVNKDHDTESPEISDKEIFASVSF